MILIITRSLKPLFRSANYPRECKKRNSPFGNKSNRHSPIPYNMANNYVKPYRALQYFFP